MKELKYLKADLSLYNTIPNYNEPGKEFTFTHRLCLILSTKSNPMILTKWNLIFKNRRVRITGQDEGLCTVLSHGKSISVYLLNQKPLNNFVVCH